MTTENQRALVPVVDCLAGEDSRQVKHEYVGGSLNARVGTSNRHNLVATNILGALLGRMRARPCRDEAMSPSERFVNYWVACAPDLAGPSLRTQRSGCSSRHRSGSITRTPPLSTTRTPWRNPSRTRPRWFSRSAPAGRAAPRRRRGEERRLSLPTIARRGCLVEQDAPAVTLRRRTDRGFLREVIEGTESTVDLQEIGTTLPRAEVNDGVDFSLRPSVRGRPSISSRWPPAPAGRERPSA